MFFEKLPDFGPAYEVLKMRQLVETLERKFRREVVYQPGTAAAATYAMPKNVDFVLVAYSVTGACAVTIPLASDRPNQTIVIKDSGGSASSNNITLTGSASNLIEGATTLVLSGDFETARLRSDGASWHRI